MLAVTYQQTNTIPLVLLEETLREKDLEGVTSLLLTEKRFFSHNTSTYALAVELFGIPLG